MKMTRLLAILFIGGTVGITALGRVVVHTQRPARVSGTGQATITVRQDQDLQAAIDEARYGDTILLEAGATYVGPLRLRNKGESSGSNTDFITIRTTDLPGISPEGERINPSVHRRSMAKIISPNGQPAVETDPQAHHYKFIGIEFAPAASARYVYAVVDLGQSDYVSLSQYPHHLVFDRCYVHSTGLNRARRGFALNSAETSVLNSYVSGFAGMGDETQAIAGWNGPGPFHIINNFLQGGAEVVLFGGSDPSIRGLVPTDIEFRRNYLTKPAEWAGRATIKGTFELKNARNVKVEGNLVESEILTTAFVLTPRNQNGKAPWSTIEDVEITNNIVRHASSGFNIGGTDNEHPSQELQRLRIVNNLLIDLTPDDPSDTAYFVQVEGTDSVLIEHNTVQQKGDILRSHGRPTLNFIFRDNIVQYNSYGIVCFIGGLGCTANPGSRADGPLCHCFPSAVITRNIMIDNQSIGSRYNLQQYFPEGNYFPTSIDAIGFVDDQHGNWRLAPDSQYRAKATDGGDPGINLDAVIAAGAEKAKTGVK